MSDEHKVAYMVARVKVDPCEYALSSLSIVVSWEGSPEGAAEEAAGMISGVELCCPCGHLQPACLRDTSSISQAVDDFNRSLKPRRVAAGPKRLTAYEKRKLRKVLLDALREAASREVNRQVCSKCGAAYSL